MESSGRIEALPELRDRPSRPVGVDRVRRLALLEVDAEEGEDGRALRGREPREARRVEVARLQRVPEELADLAARLQRGEQEGREERAEGRAAEEREVLLVPLGERGIDLAPAAADQRAFQLLALGAGALDEGGARRPHAFPRRPNPSGHGGGRAAVAVNGVRRGVGGIEKVVPHLLQLRVHLGGRGGVGGRAICRVVCCRASEVRATIHFTVVASDVRQQRRCGRG